MKECLLRCQHLCDPVTSSTVIQTAQQQQYETGSQVPGSWNGHPPRRGFRMREERGKLEASSAALPRLWTRCENKAAGWKQGHKEWHCQQDGRVKQETIKHRQTRIKNPGTLGIPDASKEPCTALRSCEVIFQTVPAHLLCARCHWSLMRPVWRVSGTTAFPPPDKRAWCTWN